MRGCFLPEAALPPTDSKADSGKVAPVFVLAGMHRSATSLFGRFLMASGVDLGEALIGPLPSNPYGHFEDLRLVELQERALTRAVTAGGRARTRFNDHERAAAREYIRQRRDVGGAWGWKDPRTCFFLDEWAELVPEASFVLLFRKPLQVVDSMCRRMERDENTKAANSRALGSWIGHNRELLRFRKSQPGRCLLIEVEDAVNRPKRFVEVLRERTGHPFDEALFQRCFDAEILRRGAPADRVVSWRLRLQAELLYRALQQLSAV